MKIYKLLIILIFPCLISCQGVQEGLGAKKKNNSDEFLVEKKNPLVLPPEYKELPVPKSLEVQDSNEIVQNQDVKKLITGKDNNTKIQKTSESSSVEKSILEKIQ